MDNKKSEHESITKGKEMGQKAYDEAKILGLPLNRYIYFYVSV